MLNHLLLLVLASFLNDFLFYFLQGDEERLVPAIPESTIENSVILYLVHVGGNINARDIYGCTPLHFAAMRGNEVATKELLSCPGINIEAVDKTQMTALHLAASHDEEEICRMLIEAGANLRCSDEDEATPLHYACAEGSMRITQMLFEAGEKQDGWVTVSQVLLSFFSCNAPQQCCVYRWSPIKTTSRIVHCTTP
jgi:ankyrin repeat protein